MSPRWLGLCFSLGLILPFPGPVQADGLAFVQSLHDTPIRAATRAVPSPDSRHLYVISDGGGLAALSQDVASGALSLMEHYPFDQLGVAGIDSGPRALAIGPDGRHVYAISISFDALIVFERDAETGLLTLGEAYPLDSSSSIVISRDGRHVYVGGSSPFRVYERDVDSGRLSLLDLPHEPPTESINFRLISADDRHVYAFTAVDFRLAIAAFERDVNTGMLSFLFEFFQFGAFGFADHMTIDPSGRHVYVSSAVGNSVSILARDAFTGALSFVEDLSFVEGLIGVWRAAISPDGHNLYAVSALNDLIGVFARDAETGLLSFVETRSHPLSGVVAVEGVEVSPDGEFVYSIGPGVAAVYRRDQATGSLLVVGTASQPQDDVAGLYGVGALATSPDGRNLYAISGPDSSLVAFERPESGTALRFLESLPFGLQNSVIVSPDGRHVYIASGSVLGFERVQPGGTLREIGSTSDRDINTVAISPDGRHLYATRDRGDGLRIFERDSSTGILTQVVDGLTVDPAFFVSVSPDGSHVYLELEEPDGTIGTAVFERSSETGLVTMLEIDRPHGRMAFSPDGLNAYAPAPQSLEVFTRDPLSGSLSFLERHQDGEDGVDGLAEVTSVAADSGGRYVYATGGKDHAITVFERDPDIGTLSFVEAIFDNTGGVDGLRGAAAVAVSADGGSIYVAGSSDNAIASFSRKCSPTTDTLCLLGDRFRVEIDWKDFDGETGSARLVPFRSGDSALLWFFNADNWEILVKVLDGCGLTDHFWVFAAAVTNVEYTLRVTDTFRGVTKSYFNPLGSASPAITDVHALASCSDPDS